MKIYAFLAALLVSISLSAGQLLFKKAALSIETSTTFLATIKHLLYNGWLLAGLFLYFLTTIGWIVLLRSAPLSLVYPVTALSFFLVPLASYFVFDEPYSWRVTLCGVLICIGIALIGYEVE